MTEPRTDPLGLPEDEMRRLGHLLVDLVVDHITGIRETPAMLTGTPEQLAAALGGPVPETGADLEPALRLLVAEALTHQQHAAHPRYFARVPGPAGFAGILGDWLGTGFNSIVASWAGGSGPSQVELVVVDWLRQLIGMPDGANGVLASGGSMGNLTAIVAARANGYDGVAYVSDQTHSSIVRALHAMGWPAELIRSVPTGAGYRWAVADVRAAVEADRAAGLRPALLIATAGTTNTGAVDPLDALADLAAEQDLWLHVDGAYGAPGILSAKGASSLAGLGRAHSVAIDPHKWLFQPFDVGCVLVRDPGVLERAFSMNPEYLRDVTAQDGEVDLRNRTLELSRRARALKLWLTFQAHGRAGIAAGISHGITLAEETEAVLAADPLWEIVTPAQLAILTFARVGKSDAWHVARAAAMTSSGWAAVGTTELGGRTVFRLCLINPATTSEDVRETLDRLAG